MGIKVNWSEWVYCGADNEVKKDMVIESINKYFSDSTLYIDWTRKESTGINRKEIKLGIETILGFQNFFIWDTKFKRAIGFIHIGVMRIGHLKNKFYFLCPTHI